MGTMDQMYALYYLINREINKKRRSMAAVFIDLKVACDSIDRNVLIKTTRKGEIRKGLMIRME